MAVMGCSGGEGGSVVEGEGRAILGEFELFVEGLDLVPVLEDFLFFLGEVGLFLNYEGIVGGVGYLG